MSVDDRFELCGLRSDEELDSRQREVLLALSKQKATCSFQGLRRKLGLHQEILSRTLDRLEERELVERTADGYRTNFEKPVLWLGDHAGSAPVKTRTITASLPREVDVSFILRNLKGRWFGEYRWLGYSQTPSVVTMSWISEDGRIELQARLLRSTLTIDAVCGSEAERQRAIRSAFELFDLFADKASVIPEVAS